MFLYCFFISFICVYILEHVCLSKDATSLFTESRSWIKQSKTGLSPSSRHFHTVVADDAVSRIILFGGWDFERWLSDIFIMNTGLSSAPHILSHQYLGEFESYVIKLHLS